MARFEDSIDEVLANEGGFSDNPADSGGVTKYGVSLRFLRERGIDVDKDGDIDAEDVTSLDRAAARQIYLNHFWNTGGYSRLDDQRIATKVFDMAVNMGPKKAHTILQRALRACGVDVAEDGVIGPKTIAAVNGISSDLLMVALRSESAGFYRSLVAGNRALAVFLRGWLRRAYR